MRIASSRRPRRRSSAGAACSTLFLSLLFPAAPAVLLAQESAQEPVQDPSVPAAAGSDANFLDALDRAVGELPVAPPAETAASLGLPGGARLELVDLSFDVLTSAGLSTERNDSLSRLELGGHDPSRRGFQLGQLEVSAVGAVDPYFRAEIHLVHLLEPDSGETATELEEAYFRTSSLPGNFELRGGMFLTPFGLTNPRHPHTWEFVNQPVILGRVFGGDGMRAPGLSLSWLAPVPWYGEVSFAAQNADGEQMQSFLGNDETELPGGRIRFDRSLSSFSDLVLTARVLQATEPFRGTEARFGLSGAFGPNAAGRSTRTTVYGADLDLKWQPAANDDGWPFVLWQSEYVGRRYGTDAELVDPDPNVPGDEGTLAGDTLRDSGFSSQVSVGLRRNWIAGLRYERAWSTGAGVIPRAEDFLRDDRTRLSPLLVWQPTHFSRVSLQYDFDRADHLPHGDAQSVWLRLEFLLGRHPAHTY